MVVSCWTFSVTFGIEIIGEDVTQKAQQLITNNKQLQLPLVRNILLQLWAQTLCHRAIVSRSLQYRYIFL